MKYGQKFQLDSVPEWAPCTFKTKSLFFLSFFLPFLVGCNSEYNDADSITLTHFLTAHLDNLDYDELKDLIKKNTTRDSGKSIAIPGHVDTTLLAFENEFFTELSNQHDRVELFVKSKSEEIGRRLREYNSSRDSNLPTLTG